jgi:hypothetical protein
VRGVRRRNFAETEKFSKISLYVWDVIGVGFKSSLVIFEQNVNSVIYADALVKRGFVGLANATFGERHWYLVQDAASCHMSTQSLDVLFEICNVVPEGPQIPLS